MINGIIGGQAVTLNPILRAPSALLAGAAYGTSSTAATVSASLRTAADVSGTNSTTAYVNLVNATAKGVFLFCAFYANGAGAVCTCQITIDGVVVYSGATANIRVPVGCVSALDTTAQTSSVSFEAVPFYTSLKIEYKSDLAASAVGAAAKYRLT